MGYQKERDEFIAAMTEAGVPLHSCMIVLRNASTLDRIANENCSSEWAEKRNAADAARCPNCQQEGYEGKQPFRPCAECRAETRIRAALNGSGVTADFSGDPRGYVVKLHLPSGKYNTFGGLESGYGVPTRNR